MNLSVLKYGHPMLRKKGAHVDAVTPAIKELIANMFETMNANRGIGLAAQQVGHALQLTVLDLRNVTDRPSTLELSGQSADVNNFMPLVLINPQLKTIGQPIAGPEGCLSFPEIFAEITRPESVEVIAMNEKGQRLEFRCGGLLARAVQHETDHLQGILFIDRMTTETKASFKEELDELQTATKTALKKK